MQIQLFFMFFFSLCPGAAGCAATLLHDAVMNPADGEYQIMYGGLHLHV